MVTRYLACQNGGVTLWSRRGTVFTTRFPAVARACEKLPPETVIEAKWSLLTTLAVLRSTCCRKDWHIEDVKTSVEFVRRRKNDLPEKPYAL